MICKKCQAPKEQGKRCGECHKRRCRDWHNRFIKAGVRRDDGIVDVFRSPVTGETLLDKSVDNRQLMKPAIKPRKKVTRLDLHGLRRAQARGAARVAEQRQIDKNTYERARRARKKVEAAASPRR